MNGRFAAGVCARDRARISESFRVRDGDLLLIDVGNVLFHDAPIDLLFSFLVYEGLRAQGSDVHHTPWEILKRTRESPRSPRMEQVVAFAWSETLNRWPELCVPIRGSLEALARLRGVRKAVLANQPPETAAVLERYGASQLLEGVFLDSMVGLSKPNVAFFRHALTCLNTAPDAAWMVGDRADNDLAPARALGLRTAWIRPPLPQTVCRVRGVPEAWWRAYVGEMQRTASAAAAPEADVAFDSFSDFVRCMASS
jgi:HAD superfamily hydrolase (TIGR01549 family)